MTTGLLLEAESSPEVQGPLGALRRQLNQLQQPQADLGGYGRSDSTGPHTLKLLQPTGATTNLLPPAGMPRSHRASGIPFLAKVNPRLRAATTSLQHTLQA